MKCVLKHLKGSINLGIRLEVEATPIVKWWVDTLHAVPNDCKSHTGAIMTLGKGMAITLSQKQKINGTNLTESEIIGVDDTLPHTLWTKYFLECQGYDLGPSILHQDNKSALLLETNGMRSASRCTKHFKVHNFFIKDKVDQKEIVLKYCPTEEMRADVLTKPKLGKIFKGFRSKLMNIPIDIPISHIEAPNGDHSQKETRKHSTHIIVPVQECDGTRTCLTTHRHTKDKQWPHVLLNGSLWDPIKYIELLSKGLARKIACVRSFVT